MGSWKGFWCPMYEIKKGTFSLCSELMSWKLFSEVFAQWSTLTDQQNDFEHTFKIVFSNLSSKKEVIIATSWVKITIINKPVLEHNSQQQLSQKGGIIGIKSSSQLIGCIFGNTGLTKHHRQSSSQPQWQGPAVEGNITVVNGPGHVEDPVSVKQDMGKR